MKQFAPFFEAGEGGASVADLKAIYEKIRKGVPDLPPGGTKAAMTESLRNHEESRPDKCELLEADTQFYGWSRGTNLLDKYVQWVYVPAVKDASTEQEEGTKTALGQLLQRTIRTKVDFQTELRDLQRAVEEKYRQVIGQQQEVLTGLQNSIRDRLREWTNANAALLIRWNYDPEKSVVVNEPVARVSIGDDEDFVGEVPRLGHGMQRAFLVALLSELATQQAALVPTLLLGFEEPELYQHPPQAQHIADVLVRLAQDHAKKTQVLVTSHSPYFVTGKGFEAVRMVRKDPKYKDTRVSAASYERIAQILADALGEKVTQQSSVMASVEQIMQPSQRELFFTPVAVIVEGREDLAFFTTHLHVTGKWEEFRRLGCHFVIAEGKTNMSRLLAIAREMSIPAFVVVDADANETRAEERRKHEKDNKCLLKLCRIVDASPLPSDTIWASNIVMWSSDICETVKMEVGEQLWLAAEQKVRRDRGLSASAVNRKNCLLIAGVIEELSKQGTLSAALDQASDQIFLFARAQANEPPA